MTSVIVDRRTQKGKSTANRQRLLKRLDGALKAQLGKMIARHKLQDAAQPAEVTIERKDATEPRLILDPATGSTGRIIPGNDKYRIGDKIANSSSEGQGGGNGPGAEGGFEEINQAGAWGKLDGRFNTPPVAQQSDFLLR